MRETRPLTGALGGSPEPPSEEPDYGWRELWDGADLDPEHRVSSTLSILYGLDVEQAGARNQSFDLRIRLGCAPFAKVVGLETGNYEVKSLWRRGPRYSFDRRFKVGQRGELIYGLRDAHIKAFALALEEQIDFVMEHSVQSPPAAPARDEMLRFCDATHGFIGQATQRRHSKGFETQLDRLARICLVIPTMTKLARSVLTSGVQPDDILRGFRDLEGIFLTAGPIYTLVTSKEIPKFIAFDSASCEGPKLRYTKAIPSEKKPETRKNGI